MSYIHFTDRDKEMAITTDLKKLLESEGEDLKRSGSEWEWRDSQGAKVTIRGNEWFHQYDFVGGGAVSFVRRFYNLNYPEAMQKLLGYSGVRLESDPRPTPSEIRKPFKLPEAHNDMRRVFAYLLKRRFIDREIISHFAHEGTIFEDTDFHNIVFVGKDENGIPRHAHKKSTSINDDSFRGNVTGCRPEYSFHHLGTGGRLYVFEAPIDLMAYISLHKNNWKQHSYVAMCSVAEHALLHRLKQNPNLNEVVICTDNDAAGIEAYYRLKEIVEAQGEYLVRQELSEFKDFNEDLKALNGIIPISAAGHPRLELVYDMCDQIAESCIGTPCPKNISRKLLEGYNRLESMVKYNSQAENIEEKCFEYASLAFLYTKKVYSHIGSPLTADEICERMKSLYQPHKDRNKLPGKLEELKEAVTKLDTDKSSVMTESEYKLKADSVLRVGLDFLRISAFVLTEQNQAQDLAPQIYGGMA